MTMKLIHATVAAALLAACGPGPGGAADEDTTAGETTGDGPTTEGLPTDPSTPTDTSDTSSPSDPTTPTMPTEDTGGTNPGVGEAALAENSEVDVLFVIDNSGSMAEEQGRLAADIGALVDALAGLDFRVGVTTTDVGNPRCANTAPESGNLVLTSCLDRVAAGEFETIEGDFSSACTDVCAKTDADLPVIPTATQLDATEAPRKWVERTAGTLNVAGADAAEALRCYLPQGVTGCGFESHLEAMFRALAASGDKNAKNNFGFVRDAAVLAVVVVSDEADCSANPDHESIFIDNKVFWSDPADPAPTSAVCWNAGVACTGDGPTFEECHAEDHDIAGMAGAEEPDAVLVPVRKYVEFLQAIEDGKRQFDPSAEVVVSLIAGVPSGYESFAAELSYTDAFDADFLHSFGIGPGCINGTVDAPTATAVPPVREREFAEWFNVDPEAGRNISSICDESYQGALAQVGEDIRDRFRPLCFPLCVRDAEPETTTVEPTCTVSEVNLFTDTKTELQECVEAQGAWVPPAGQTVCFAELIDKGGETFSPLDDMATECLDIGFNLQFAIVRTAPKPAGTTLSASCELSTDKTVDCPGL